jgi:hypothetical protein
MLTSVIVERFADAVLVGGFLPAGQLEHVTLGQLAFVPRRLLLDPRRPERDARTPGRDEHHDKGEEGPGKEAEIGLRLMLVVRIVRRRLLPRRILPDSLVRRAALPVYGVKGLRRIGLGCLGA